MDVSFRVKISVNHISVELEGSEQFVRNELAYFKEKWFSRVEDLQLKEAHAPFGLETNQLKQKPPIKYFIDNKAPQSDMEAAAVIAYYLRTWEGIDEIEGKLLSEWSIKAERKPSKNSYQTLLDAKLKKGYFDKGSKRGSFKLSNTGLYFVEHELSKT